MIVESLVRLLSYGSGDKMMYVTCCVLLQNANCRQNNNNGENMLCIHISRIVLISPIV